jgi:predicted MPP superfamily phosphohydrolase
VDPARRKSWKLVRVAMRVTFLILVLTVLCLAYGFWIEPTWLHVRYVTLSQNPSLRIIFFTDLHYNGDQKYLEKVLATINRLPADLVCFGGDITEKEEFFDQALDMLRSINKPMYGIPGNHDYWSRIPFEKVAGSFRATGGDWLCDTNVVVLGGTLEITGRTGCDVSIKWSTSDKIAKRLLLVHYPDLADRITNDRFDLILAGHNHGGQVCLPWLGPVLTLVDGEEYRSGFLQKSAGPLYVGAGVGSYLLPFRFLCRPEIVVIEL